MRRTGFLSLAAAPLLAFAPTAGPDQALTVTEPVAGSVHASGSSMFVTWQNPSGKKLDMWLVRDGSARVAQLASRLTSAARSETSTVLPNVPDGTGYSIELVSRDGDARGYSPSFSVGPTAKPAGGAAQRASSEPGPPGAADRARCTSPEDVRHFRAISDARPMSPTRTAPQSPTQRALSRS
ncbi:Ser-Thr-rich GPI-anchored membrane family protein [Streptomyces sp. BYX5S]